MQKKWIPIVLFSFLMIQVANAQSNDEKKWLRKKYNSLSFNQKIAQLMIIRAHSNWDNNKVDGDLISLNLNGVWILKNYLLKKEVKDILIYLTFIVGLFVFIGCEKEEFSLNSNENNAIDIHVSSNNATNICVPGYSSNAFDSIGILHNYWVGYIESLCYPDDSIQRVIYVTDSVLLGEFGQSFSSCLWDLDDIEDFNLIKLNSNNLDS